MPRRKYITAPGDSGLQDTNETTVLLSLVAALSLEDIEHVRRQSVLTAGSPGSGSPNDEEFALQLFAEEALALESLARDMRLAQSLNTALEADTGLLEEIARSEEACRRDREYALALAAGRPLPIVQELPPIVDSGTMAVRRVLDYSSTSAASLDVAARSSTIVSISTTTSTKARVETCVICRDPIEGPVVHAPCGDFYDVGCLVDLFRAAMVDETLFPPACCRQPFEVEEVRIYLDKDLQKSVDRKTIEFGTKNRVYCHKPTCSAFIGAATPAATRVLCTTCWAYTCGHCKAAAHSLSIRCTNSEDAAVVALAEESGWKRCPGCGHLVELSIGCYHMTCRCRHQFCYLCTAPWRTCTCQQWDEERLLVVAQDRVQRQGVRAPTRGGDVGEYHRRVAREAERLRVDHNCVHRWKYVVTEGRCEGCSHYLRLFLFNCRGCHMWACARCRRNRWL
ncbi:hypothetical protein C8Q77DRAFT_1043749 [Trametes polyzona]|nr:hypothetical protein C8Q77DRAFT_1043749 [Trametes polyzona]